MDTYLALETLPVVFLFTAGTIASYMWRKLYITANMLSNEMSLSLGKYYMKRSFIVVMSCNLLYYTVYSLMFVLRGGDAMTDSELIL
jgi:hypothetical protein